MRGLEARKLLDEVWASAEREHQLPIPVPRDVRASHDSLFLHRLLRLELCDRALETPIFSIWKQDVNNFVRSLGHYLIRVREEQRAADASELGAAHG